jgi:metallo-beta-lactamase class B
MKTSKYDFIPANYEDFYRHPEKYRVPAFRIFGNLFFTGNADVGSYLVDSGAGLILIDTAYPTTQALIIQSIWELGFNPKDIKIILHTHGHFDHFGATALLKSLSGAKLYLGARDARNFRNRPELALLDCGRHAYQELFVPDVELADGDVIRLGNAAIRAVATPGHSDGVMSFFFDVSDGSRTLTAGLHGGAGMNSLNRNFIARYGNIHSRAEFIASLAKVRDEKVDIVLGNHTAQNDTLGKLKRWRDKDTKGNPFVDPGEWVRLIDGLKARFDQMLDDEAHDRDRL